MAEAFDVALLVQFVEWDDWLDRMADVSPAALEKRSFDLARLMALRRPPHPARQAMPDKRVADPLGSFQLLNSICGLQGLEMEGVGVSRKASSAELTGRQGKQLLGSML